MSGRDVLSGALALGCVAPARSEEVTVLEDAGIASLWVGGHIASRNPSPEALAWLARLTAQSQSAILGTAVLLLPLYPPAIVAKMVADLDNACGGRIALGIGVGGEYPAEFDACQVPLSERGPRTDEAMTLLRTFWSGEPVTAPGPHFPMTDIRIHPAPAQPGGPPLIAAGRRAPAMRRAARLGDGWMPYLFSPERYARSVATIRQEAAGAGRSLDGFGWLAYLPVCLDADPGCARQSAAEFLGGTYRQDFADFIDRVAVTGTAEDVRRRLQDFIDAGARHLVLLPTVREGATDMVLEIASDIFPSLTVRS